LNATSVCVNILLAAQNAGWLKGRNPAGGRLQ